MLDRELLTRFWLLCLCSVLSAGEVMHGVPPPKQVKLEENFIEHQACPACGYDLFGLPCEGALVRCPECGRTSIPSMPRRRKRIRIPIGNGTLLAVSLLLAFVTIASLSYAIDENQEVPEAVCWAHAIRNGVLVISVPMVLAGACLGAIWCERIPVHRIFRRKRRGK